MGGLELLALFRPDIVKIDPRLVRSLQHNRVNYSIVESVIHLAKELEYEVVATGVETRAELRVLRKLGVSAFQGYYFARPALEKLELPKEWEHSLE